MNSKKNFTKTHMRNQNRVLLLHLMHLLSLLKVFINFFNDVILQINKFDVAIWCSMQQCLYSELYHNYMICLHTEQT